MQNAPMITDIVFAVVSLLLIASLVLAICSRIKIPFTIALVIVGMVLSQGAYYYPEQLGAITRINISPELILFVFLPTLIFESTFNLDARHLFHNLGPILTLAIPGLLLSTFIIGLIVSSFTPIPILAALLLGAILSATDPVAVVALFRQLGAPERLTIMMEGESLFNDATAIVLTHIMVGILLSAGVSNGFLASGLLTFFNLFVGGIIVGVILGGVTGLLLARVESNPFIEISLTTALAYLSFLVAEHFLHVSGVMATMAAGLVMGGWGRLKISSSVARYLGYFWEHLAFIANALIFLLVGLTVNWGALLESIDILLWVVLAMLLARATLIYLLLPMIGRLPGSAPIKPAYKLVMFWGGLRGAIALALVLSLPVSEYSDLFAAVVTGAVIFTLLVQGLTIEPLMRLLHLNNPPLADRIVLLEGKLESRLQIVNQIPQLRSEGLVSNRIATQILQECDLAIDEVKSSLQGLRESELNPQREQMLLYLRVFIEERQIYTQMFHQGHLSEGAYRELVLILTMQIDALRHTGAFQHIHSHRIRRLAERGAYKIMDRYPWLTWIAERLRMSRLIRNYEEVWGHFQGSAHGIVYLQRKLQIEEISPDIVNPIIEHYRRWHRLAREQLEQISEQFPEFVRSMQERLGERMLLLIEAKVIKEQMEEGLLPRGVAEEREQQIARKLSQLRGLPAHHLHENPLDLLRQVPLFSALTSQQLEWLSQRVTEHTLDSQETIIEQGDQGDAIYLIIRGVIRIIRMDAGEEIHLQTLIAGDFFGEKAMMGHHNGTATVRSVTPCKLFRLKRTVFEELLKDNPELHELIQKVDQSRQQQMKE